MGARWKSSPSGWRRAHVALALLFVALLSPSRASAQEILDAGSGSRDAGALDAGLSDAGALDADAPDAGALDADVPDASDASVVPLAPEDPASGSAEILTLPPVEEDERPNPVVVDAPVPAVEPVLPRERPGVVIKTILGLVALLALAYVGGHPRVQEWERTLRLSQVITAGSPFIALGIIARLPEVGILTDPVLAELGPLLRIGLGWIGFLIGFRFDARMLQEIPRGIARLVAVQASITFAVIVGASAVLLLGSSGFSRAAFTDPVFIRDALILGVAGSLTSLATPRLLEDSGGHPDSVASVARVVRLQELTGIVGLLVIAAYFRPQGDHVTWQLPGTAWLLLTLGAGAGMGGVVYAILLRRTTASAESAVLILGSIAFAAGLAGNLRLSPVVVCFVCGLLLVNFPGSYKDRLRETLARLERPIYLVFLVVVGALFRVGALHGWLLLAVFVAARVVGTWAGTRLGARSAGLALRDDATRTLTIAPMGALSIAIVVNAQILYPSGSISSIVTAVVGGAVVTEVLVQILTRRAPSPAPAPSRPPDASPVPVPVPVPVAVLDVTRGVHLEPDGKVD